MLHKKRKQENTEMEDLVNSLTSSTKTNTGSFRSSVAGLTAHIMNPNLFSDKNFLHSKRSLPLIGNMSAANQYKILGSLAFLSFFGLVFGGSYYINSVNKDSMLTQMSTNFSTHVRQVDRAFSGAIKNQTSQQELLDLANQIKLDFEGMRMEFAQPALASNYNKIVEDLNNINKNIGSILSQSGQVSNKQSLLRAFSKEIDQTTAYLNRFIAQYTSFNINKESLENAYNLRNELQKLSHGTTYLLLGQENTYDINNIRKIQENIKNILTTIKNGSSASNIASLVSVSNSVNLNTDYKNLENNVNNLFGQLEKVLAASSSSLNLELLQSSVSQSIDNIALSVNNLNNTYVDNNKKLIALSVILLSLLLLLCSIVLIFIIYDYENYNRSLLEKIEHNKNRDSILKLIAEMEPLQKGDLTKETSVTEEIAGSIADSINATIASLASLVKKIKDTSIAMKEKTTQVNNIATHMLEMTEAQTSALQDTGKAVLNISDSISDIAHKTHNSAQQALKSVSISQLGSEQVNESVLTIQEISRYMEETVSWMKKVDSSSKQIYEIIELLSGITEETSILALNATVQAARAGDAGKGFKIVADSIQGLSDKASEATRRVSALISAVQGDIRAVANSIDKTTEEIEKGVVLSASAGESLQKVTAASQELSTLVASISQDAQRYSVSAKDVNDSMGVILENTENAKRSTQLTVDSIKEINQISDELKASVQTFKINEKTK